MKRLNIAITGAVLYLLCACQHHVKDKYIFFLHNRFLEVHELEDRHPVYGRTEYVEILEKFKEEGFIVMSEHREGAVNARNYAMMIVGQIDSLLAIGVDPQDITVVGTSKGGYIAQYVSTIANNPELNYVFVASFRDSDIESIPEINYCGNILSIYDKSDPYGVSAIERIENSRCTIEYFKEIELNTGMGHGFLFKPLRDWIEPTVKWAHGEYESIGDMDNLYRSHALEIKKLSDQVFIHTSYLKEYNNHPCNGVVYIDHGEAVVLDSPTDAAAAAELIRWIGADLKCDIKAIVINHFHIDCLGGLAEFHNNGIPSYASDRTIAWAGSEKSHNGIIPQNGFKEALRIKVGESYIENRYFGPGHTDDNIVSYIEDKNILFGGCLIKAYGAGKGSLTDALEEDWSMTVSKVRNEYASDLHYVIPGHGDPGGVELLDYTIDLFMDN